MVSGKFKSRTFRRIFRKTPGGRNVLHFELRKPAKQRCGSCGKLLSGMLRMRSSELGRMTKTEKRPSRPYGGVLCSSCTREIIKQKARGIIK